MTPRTVVVTGGTGALGSALVATFLDGGDRVVVPWIDRDERDALAARHTSCGARLRLVEADVTDAAGAASLSRHAPDTEVLVNGVGGFAGGSPVHETGLEVWDRLLRLNLLSAVVTIRALLPGMLARRRGTVVNVAAQAAFARPPGLAAYAASKAALAVLTEILQKEVAERGIRVNAVAPGTIDTPANRRAMAEADFAAWTPPERIAQVVHWLASPAATAVRGAVIPV